MTQTLFDMYTPEVEGDPWDVLMADISSAETKISEIDHLIENIISLMVTFPTRGAVVAIADAIKYLSSRLRTLETKIESTSCKLDMI